MTLNWSPHAISLFTDILDNIFYVLSAEDMIRWRYKIEDSVLILENHPLSGTNVPPECFETIPPNVDELRQIWCINARPVSPCCATPQ